MNSLMAPNVSQAYKANKYEGMSPARLVLALLDGALSALDRAKQNMLAGNIAARGEAISKAISIVGELQASLNFEHGGEIASNLNHVYDFVLTALPRANLKSDLQSLQKCHKMLHEIREGWHALVIQQETPAAEPQAKVAAKPAMPSAYGAANDPQTKLNTRYV